MGSIGRNLEFIRIGLFRMGGHLSSPKVTTRKVAIAGLDGSGKTTLMYKILKPNENIAHPPTLGFSFEFIDYRKV